MSEPVVQKLTFKDFESDQEVRWCPGCGDYAILKTIQRTLPELDVPKENHVFISGIGCSSRFPYYMNAYGFHTIHGRAPSIATGVRLANPDLDVWVITGDGDSLSIGGNHTMHVLRRNVDLQLLLFNNEIYGLTKGQYSPTSKVGTKSPSTPDGSVDRPIVPCSFAMGVGARFIARAIDTEVKNLGEVLKRGHEHVGASFIEIYQNCHVYNDGTFELVKDKKSASDHRIDARHGEPLVFGKDNEKGLRLNSRTLQMEVVSVSDVGLDAILVHDETNKTLARTLIDLQGPDFPVVFGVLYCNPASAYVTDIYDQYSDVRGKREKGDVNKLLRSGHTWKVD
jgi:2-oxoglutarate ferredoxin oxidoreductase subunit beta